MAYLIFSIIGIYLHMMITWLFFLAVMSLDRRKEELVWVHKIFAVPLLIIGLILDFSFNILEGSIMFLEVPKELTFSGRCGRFIKSDGFRGTIAKFWCKYFLNPFDKSGNHCG